LSQSPLKLAGGGCLGAVIGLIVGAVIAMLVASAGFDSDFQSAKSKIDSAREQRNATAKPATNAKELKDGVLVGVGNAGADALSPSVEASFYWSFKVVAGSIAGLIVGAALGLVVASRMLRPA
jgi:uncharacterized membrane-anchored protein YhcB (DUF1043 family)